MIRIALALALAAAATPAAAQAPDPAKVVIRAETLAPGVAVLFGQGGNIGVSFGPDGTAIIDDQFAALTPKISAAIAALPATPPRFVLDTHWHGDHTGGNDNFGKAGAVIIAQDNVRKRLSAARAERLLKQNLPDTPTNALPMVTFDDGVTIHLNGDTLRFVHVRNAHTDGDAMIKFEKANVLHTGDLFVTYGLPFIDTDSGGSIQGMIAGIDRALALSDAATKIIPGHGPVSKRAEMIAFRTMLTTIMARVAAGMKAGKTLAAIQAEKPAAQWDTNPEAFIHGDDFVATLHGNLAAPPPGFAGRR